MATIQLLLATLLSLLLITSTTALPTPGGPPNLGSLGSRISQMLSNAQKRTVPPNSTLPAPLSSLTLKYIALGLGTQNYTCASTPNSPTAAPVQVGALANLFDATDTIVAVANSPLTTVSKAMSAGPCQADAHNTAASLRQIGQHYFDIAGTPTFDLGAEGMLLKAKKMASAAAPSDACVGRDGGAAVPWLMLQDDGSGRSEGLGQVFRVETAGGAAPATCEGVGGEVERDYAALYYLYG